MSGELDYNKIIAEIFSKNIDKIYESAKSKVSGFTNTIRSRLKRTFTSYLENLNRKYSVTKTLIYRETPQPILSFYEPLDLHNADIKLKSPKLPDIINLNSPVIITGSGGSGKSTLLKYFLLNALEDANIMPIFIELRYLESKQSSLLDHIAENLKLHTLKLPKDFISSVLSRGGFVIFLDGLDELSSNQSQKISTEINELVDNQVGNSFIVTSRPGIDFTSWTNFIELKTTPLTLDKACSLVKKLQIEKELKKRFTKDLKSEIFEAHQSFFENPLLLSIMLITYQDSASIPAQLHNFYSFAFDALFFRHDASKAGFRRPTKTEIDVDIGRKVMSGLSLVTSLDEKFVFNKTEIISYLKDAQKLIGTDYKTNDLLDDLISAYCMLIQDGTQYAFTHRSFQEYFSACYLVNAVEDEQRLIVDNIVKRLETDMTLHLAFGMNQKLIEKLLIIPFLEKTKRGICYSGKVTKKCYYKFLDLYCERINVRTIDGKDDYYYSLSASQKNESRFIFVNLIHFIRGKYDKELNIQLVNRRIDSAEDVISAIKCEKGSSLNISDLSQKRGLSTMFYELCYFKNLIPELFSLKDIIEKRHQDQKSSLIKKLTTKGTAVDVY